MLKVIDDKIKEFIDRELESINLDKERVTEEKCRIRTEIYKIYNIEYSERTNEQNDSLAFLQEYDDVLTQQYNLLCKRDIAIFGLVMSIGESAMKESQMDRGDEISANNRLKEDQSEEYDQVI